MEDSLPQILPRNENAQDKLTAADCRGDLIVLEKAHKMSTTRFGGEFKYTRRYKMGQ